MNSKARPYLRLTIVEIKTLYSTSPNDTKLVEQLTYELSFRKTNKAKQFLSEITQISQNGSQSIGPSRSPIKVVAIEKPEKNIPPVVPKESNSAFSEIDISNPSKSYLQEFIQGIQEEIDATEAKGKSEINLKNGVLKKIESGEYVYSFVIDELIIATDDQPVELKYQSKQYKAFYVGKLGESSLIRLKDDLGEKISSAVLIISPIFFLEALIETLQKIASIKNYNFDFPHSVIGKKMLPDTSQVAAINEFAPPPNESQKNAIKTALGSCVTFIWGPPGTGKTTVIASIVENLISNKKRVLITSHTNVAVDTALRDVLQHKGSEPAYWAGSILRYGVHQLSSLDKYPLVFGHNLLVKLSSSLVEQLADLSKEESLLTKKNIPLELELNTWRIIENLLTDLNSTKTILSQVQLEIENTIGSIANHTKSINEIKNQINQPQSNGWIKKLFRGVQVATLTRRLKEDEDKLVMLQKGLVSSEEKKQALKVQIAQLNADIQDKTNGRDISHINAKTLASEFETNLQQIQAIRDKCRDIQEQIESKSKTLLGRASVVATELPL